jgi:hypothetical protein
MPESFFTGLHRSWFAWSGWLFTVGGTVYALAISEKYAWIGALIAMAGLLALTAFAYQRHQELRSVESAHAADRTRLEEELRTASERAEEAERKIDSVSAELVLRIQEFFSASSFQQCISYLISHAQYVGRMVEFVEQTASHPPSLRTFVNQSGKLYAIARVESAAIGPLKDGDPFVLTHKDSKGLITDSAQLLLHQRDQSAGTLWFRVEAYLSDEMAHLEALASKKDVAGLTGYSIRPVCAVQQYTGANLTNAVELVRRLAEEMAQKRGLRG